MKKFDTKPTLVFINSGNVLTLKYVYDPFIGVKFDGKLFKTNLFYHTHIIYGNEVVAWV